MAVAESGIGGVGAELDAVARRPAAAPADRPAAAPAGTGTAADTPAAVPPTIYDVARAAGVSIASVSRVLNGRRNPRQDTKERVERAVAELGFIPDGAARALSARLKEVVGVVVRRPLSTGLDLDEGGEDEGAFADEAESLQFPDMLNRGIERAAQLRGFDLLVRTVDVDDHESGARIIALARKSDGLILHDRLLDPQQLHKLSRQVPVVTLAGVATATTANVRSDNVAGMRELARHLLTEHGYRTVGYLGGYGDSPDNIARQEALAEAVEEAGAELLTGPGWQGNYYAAGGAAVTQRLLASGVALPRVIVCANDQTALGVMYILRNHGISVPDNVAVTGFDDIPMAKHLHPRLTTVRQPIGELGETAFEVLYAMIGHEQHGERDIVLPARLVRRESCGCVSQTREAL